MSQVNQECPGPMIYLESHSDSFDYQDLFSLGKGSTGCVQVFQVCQVCQLGEVSEQSVQYVGGRTSQWSVGEEAVQERLFHQIPRQGVFFFCCLFAR